MAARSETTVVRYHREWSHSGTLDGQWFTHGKSSAAAYTNDMPFSYGGGYATEAEAWAELPPRHWSNTRVIRVTLVRTVEDMTVR